MNELTDPELNKAVAEKLGYSNIKPIYKGDLINCEIKCVTDKGERVLRDFCKSWEHTGLISQKYKIDIRYCNGLCWADGEFYSSVDQKVLRAVCKCFLDDSTPKR